MDEDWFVSLSGEKIMPRAKNARFIVFDSLDGSGQSTQIKLLEEYLKGRGYDVLITKEPSFGSVAGDRIREVLAHKVEMDPKELQKLFVEDRREHIEKVIIPALKTGKVVISDRYFFSTFAFGAKDADLEWLIDLNKEYIMPDITFILKVRPEICVERIQKRGAGVQLFEKTEILKRVWAVYEKMPERFNGRNIYILDGEKAIEYISKEVIALVDKVS